ncbi:predicted protein [Naegleria gruberi]|uniref:Predicted protein n=1 Tax=Naegleria gruberi TaxID=5762 RepID=D2W2T8_NAEGR|nr:uncharacterized protein NAEGRDRAFT_75709 [Naegleria gruberi]EFC36570.1 predicted protein [Naegleria gruberi]|eukprot:XP_002669314.1 predicted protein [Naegleria gruberi strain NEG-M]
MKAFLKNFAKAIGGSDKVSSESQVLLENIPFEAKMREQYPCNVLGYSTFYNDQGLPNDRTQQWCPYQVIGPPTCYPNLGDNVTAWCPAGMAGPEHIIVEYEKPVIAKEVHVYETLGPGSTCKISCKVYKGEEDKSEEWIVLWEDKTVVTNVSATAARDFSPPISQLVLTKVIRVDLNITSTWSEIDTIKLVGNYDVDHVEITELGSEYRQLFTQAQEDGQNYSDVTISLVNSDKQINAHKGIIASRSPYLLKQLTVQDGPQIHLGLDVSFESLKQAISFLYCNHCAVSLDTLFELYAIANIFDCDDLKEFCEHNLTLLLTPSNLQEVYDKAVQNHHTSLTDTILRVMFKHYDRIQQLGLQQILTEKDALTLKNMRRSNSK